MTAIAGFAVVAAAVAGTPAERQALFQKLKHSVVVVESTTPSGERLGNGTGFVVRADGLIVTNHHVIDHDAPLRVVFSDGRKLPVTGIKLSDEGHDLALLQVEAQGLAVLELGDSSQLVEGARAFIAGNPLGLDFSFAEGTVAAIRPQGLPKDVVGSNPKPADLQELLQLDINSDRGGSGSPIVDEAGAVIGIERAGVGRASFAVPVNTLKAALTKDVLAAEARPLHAFPWWNLLISAGVLAVVALFLLGRLKRGGGGGGGGRPKAQRKYTGYEE